LIIVFTNIFISVLIYFVIVTVLLIIDKKGIDRNSNQNSLSFDELVFDYSELPALKTFISRDESSLNYRFYPSISNKVIILVHGSGWHSYYFLPLADYINSENITKVYTPDLRGHGINPVKRGYINCRNQLEDDLADFVSMV
jgi:non-heme chloroperoxidase